MLVSIVYFSRMGHTARQAHAVAEGVRRVSGAECRVVDLAVGEAPWDVLEKSAAIIFGSPTFNGNISAKMKQFFEDSTRAAWTKLKWRDKIAAGFTNSGAQHGDKLHTLIGMAIFAAQHGMIWVGLDLFAGNSDSKGSVHDLNRHGSWLGAMAQSNVDEAPNITPIKSDLETATHLGRRVAEIARRLHANAAG